MYLSLVLYEKLFSAKETLRQGDLAPKRLFAKETLRHRDFPLQIII